MLLMFIIILSILLSYLFLLLLKYILLNYSSNLIFPKSKSYPKALAKQYFINHNVKYKYSNNPYDCFYNSLDNSINMNSYGRNTVNCITILHETAHSKQIITKYKPWVMFNILCPLLPGLIVSGLITFILFLILQNMTLFIVLISIISILIFIKVLEVIYEGNASIQAYKFFKHTNENTKYIVKHLFICWYTYFISMLDYVLIIPFICKSIYNGIKDRDFYSFFAYFCEI